MIVFINSWINNMNDSHKTQLSAACLLLSVAEADNRLEKQEIDTIQEILKDFFSITDNNSIDLLHEAQGKIKISTDLFEFGQYLNSVFDQMDRLDFISCIFEVAFADGNLHYLEHHTIKKIANILNISREDILASKNKIKYFLD